MNGWVGAWLDKRVNELIGGLEDGSIDGMKERINGWVDG